MWAAVNNFTILVTEIRMKYIGNIYCETQQRLIVKNKSGNIVLLMTFPKKN